MTEAKFLGRILTVGDIMVAAEWDEAEVDALEDDLLQVEVFMLFKLEGSNHGLSHQSSISNSSPCRHKRLGPPFLLTTALPSA